MSSGLLLVFAVVVALWIAICVAVLVVDITAHSVCSAFERVLTSSMAREYTCCPLMTLWRV